ncbi:MAG: hypothetical protein JWO02_2988 [Solirubrobacterales bacterium]|nr:hypothetical protein [Solirubrobacterales bacterium]
MDVRTTTTVEYLEQALALENRFEQRLASHIAATPNGEYRSLLERHRFETAAHARRVGTRLRDLGAQPPWLALGYGLLRGAASQMLALVRTPLDRLSGPGGGEEQLLCNARDEIASEGAQIALYDVIEALADRVDDTKTVILAREHRLQELLFVDDLRGVMPALVDDFVDARVDDRQGAAERMIPAGDAGRSVTDDAADEAVEAVLDRLEDERMHTAIAGNDLGGEPLPVALRGYDQLLVAQILPRLEGLSADELAAIDSYERAGRARKQIFNRVQVLRNRAADELLSRLS